MLRLAALGAFAACALPLAAQAAPDQEVTMPAGKGEIHGAMRVPEGFTSGPAVLMIAGSGPTDRNGDSTVPGVKPGSYRLLADGLEQQGIPTLRYDKRGTGASLSALIGSAGATTANAYAAEANLRFDDLADDATGMARVLASHTGVTCIIILGHSEGSLLGMLAAQRVPVCGYISVAGLGRSADVAVLQQFTAAGVDPELLQRLHKALDQLKAGQTVADTSLPPALFRPSVQPYLISWFRYDPAVEIGKIKAPVLILQGDNDIQVSVTDAKILAAARPDGKLVIVHGMNHILKDAPTDRAANAATYADPNLPLAPEAVTTIAGFVKQAGARP